VMCLVEYQNYRTVIPKEIRIGVSAEMDTKLSVRGDSFSFALMVYRVTVMPHYFSSKFCLYNTSISRVELMSW
jgi:hypothetical protein